METPAPSRAEGNGIPAQAQAVEATCGLEMPSSMGLFHGTGGTQTATRISWLQEVSSEF